MSLRFSRRALGESAVKSTPSKKTLPSSGSYSRMIQRDSVDLPEPDSPTMPRVSPASRSTETSCTAAKRVLPRGKYFERCSTRRSGCFPLAGLGMDLFGNMAPHLLGVVTGRQVVRLDRPQERLLLEAS